MLLEFRVKNFRSLKTEQTLSMVCSKDSALKETNTFLSKVKAVPALLKGAVIYGANASGKSNLIKAIQYMRAVVVESTNKKPDELYNIQPFRLDSQSDQQPTEFEITFLIDGIRHQYGFALTPQRVIREYLLVYKAAKPQEWFNRSYDDKNQKDSFKYGSFLKGTKSVWEEATRQNVLFLSTAVYLKSEQLKPVFDWFAKSIAVINDIAPPMQEHSIGMLQNPEEKQKITDFLSAADLSIADIEVVSKKVEGKGFKLDLSTGKVELQNGEREVNELRFHHATQQGKAIFTPRDESVGTIKLLYLFGLVLDVLARGMTLVIDELNNSLHPLLARRLVELFHDPETNKLGAQLIFSTHDTSLLDTSLFRRDQIWFVEKDTEQTSNLYPLSDFSPRKNEAIEKGYLVGRYGALPFLGEWQG